MTLSIDEAFAQLLAEETPKERKKREKKEKKGIKNLPVLSKPVVAPTGMKQGFQDFSSGTPPLESWTLEGILIPVNNWRCSCGASGQTLDHHSAYILHSYNRRKDTKHLRPLRPGELASYSHVRKLLQHTESLTDVCPACAVRYSPTILPGVQPIPHPITQLLGTVSNPFPLPVSPHEKLIQDWKEVFDDAFSSIEEDKLFQELLS